MKSQEKNDILLEIIKSELENFLLFSNYSLKKQEIQKIKSPAVAVHYDTTLESESASRWLFIRVSDFYTYQKIVIWLNLLNNPKPVNFDIEKYFFDHLQIKNVAQKLSFRSSTEDVFRKNFKDVLKFINQSIDQKGRWINRFSKEIDKDESQV